MPNLILRSDHSVIEAPDAIALQCGDAVLDVKHIARWAGCVDWAACLSAALSLAVSSPMPNGFST